METLVFKCLDLGGTIQPVLKMAMSSQELDCGLWAVVQTTILVSGGRGVAVQQLLPLASTSFLSNTHLCLALSLKCCTGVILEEVPGFMYRRSLGLRLAEAGSITEEIIV